MTGKINPIRETSAEAIALAQSLVREAKFGALAFADPETGAPEVSRVAVATDGSGAPVLFISDLSPHTRALKRDPRCSLLVGEPGKGDPLAHPRVSLVCLARSCRGTAAGLPAWRRDFSRISQRRRFTSASRIFRFSGWRFSLQI